MGIYKITLNGKTYEVEVKEGEAIVAAEYEAAAPVAAPVAAPAAPAAPQAAPAPTAAPAVTGSGEVVSSPLPGTVLDIKVAQGAAVKAGQLLVIIEAMKMENEILAPKDGTVSQIVASKGASVESGAPLLVIA
ncbi:MAG: biotin/lipoyl-binding protein [Clostridia bacterium]|nr:biotin/lipoyl-binding protein [Clostridia bacterium]